MLVGGGVDCGTVGNTARVGVEEEWLILFEETEMNGLGERA